MIMAYKQKLLDLTFSSEIINSAGKSFTMSKRLTRAAVKASVLNILYNRMVLNESDLKPRKIEDISIMVLKRMNVKDPLLRHYISWMKGIDDAIDKNYLKEAFMFMKNPANDEIIEAYKFSLKYNNDDNKENARTPTHVKLAIVEFLQVINDLGNNKKLSENTEVQIELTFFGATPRNYEPPSFEASIDKYCMSISIPNCNVHLGTLKTGYHKLSCYGGGKMFTEQALAPAATETLVEEVEDKNAYEESTVENTSVDMEKTEDLAGTSKSNTSHKLDTSNITVSDRDSILSDNNMQMTEEQYSCLCQMTIPLDIDTIECVQCTKQYHAPCHGYLSKEDACRANFVCIQCSNQDLALHQISASERTIFCRIRIVLYYLDTHGQLPLDVLKLMSENHRSKVIEKLVCFNILDGKRNSKVNQVALRQVIEKFFLLDDSQLL